MVYDSIANASIPTAVSNSKEFAKKKRVNRTAKLKQSKLDVRREQWLSQVKNRGVGLKEEGNVSGGGKLAGRASREVSEVNEAELAMVKLEISVGGGGNVGGLMSHYSDSESVSNSPTNFTGSCSGSCSGSSSSGGGGCFSRSMTDEDDGEDERERDCDVEDESDCAEDWEAVADALAADDVEKSRDDANLESHVHETEPENESAIRTGQEAQRGSNNFRAWRADDVSRPQTLPNLLKQNSFPMKSGLQHGVRFAPSACPICCEDLDMTDTSFLPCPCGYRLCLFCHKRILEDNGRCPGCRKQYDQTDNKTASFKLARSHSVNPRY